MTPKDIFSIHLIFIIVIFAIQIPMRIVNEFTWKHWFGMAGITYGVLVFAMICAYVVILIADLAFN